MRGKSFWEGLKEEFGARLLLDYAHPLKKIFIINSLVAGHFLNDLFLVKRYVIIYGHSSFSRYTSLIKKDDDVKTAMFFRDPIDLLCSLYFYIKEKYPERCWRYRLVREAKEIPRFFQDIFRAHSG